MRACAGGLAVPSEPCGREGMGESPRSDVRAVASCPWACGVAMADIGAIVCLGWGGGGDGRRSEVVLLGSGVWPPDGLGAWGEIRWISGQVSNQLDT